MARAPPCWPTSAEGLGYLLRHRVLRTLAIMVAVSNLTTSAVFAVFVLFVVAPGPWASTPSATACS